MITEGQLRELLAQKTESKNLDYKEFFNWSTATNDEKCELIKDILSLFNTQDGGYIIIGVRDTDFALIGLNQDAFTSFDTTRVNDFLQRYTDPPASCEVQKLTLEGLNIVAVGVPEFKDLPIICRKDAHSSTDQSKLILKAGGLYIRTDKATSILVPSAESMRDLMNRALLKRGDQLLSTIEALLRGRPTSNEQDTLKYAEEIKAAREYFKEVLPSDFEGIGHWQLTAGPDVYNRERIGDLTTVLKFLVETEVSLRGWNFPHTDKETASNFSNGRQSHTVCKILGRPFVEAYRAYQSGLFVWRGAYRENAPEFVAQYGRALSFVNVIYEMTEMFVFLKRYYSRIAENASVHVSIEMTDIKNRALVATGDALPFLNQPTSSEPRLLIEADYTVSELRASAEELAIRVVRRIFEVFNWNDPDPNMIRGWQARLLSRTF